MFLDPGGGTQLIDLGTLQAARMTIVDILEGGRLLELSVPESRRQAAVFFPQPLAFDQESETRLEIEVGDVALAALFFEGIGHAVQTEGAELLERWMGEHEVLG
jgi:hypothetical protein